jgi:bla regulator protein BlaR1
MILGWMIYSVLLATCVAAAAQALELAARRLGRPTRWVWAFALVASVGTSELGRAQPLGLLTVVLPRAETAPWLTGPAAAFFQAYNPLERWNPLLAVALWASSALVAAFLAVSVTRLVRRRRAWRASVVDGHPVLVSESDGPAVFGFGRGTIVLPRWALSADARVRELMLVHELEHQSAGDPRLLLLALAAVLLQPWNPVVWWLARRLRLAVEVDCDARVLGRGSDLRTYGLVLLEAGRRAAACRLPVPALSMPPSSLEERLRVMCERRAGRARAGALGLVVVLAVGAAAFLPEPSALHCALESLGFPTGQAASAAR